KVPDRSRRREGAPADNNDPHKIGRREPRAEYLGWLHCRQINEIVDHCAWMSSPADSRVAYPGRILLFLANCYLALLLQRGNKHAEAAKTSTSVGGISRPSAFALGC